MDCNTRKTTFWLRLLYYKETGRKEEQPVGSSNRCSSQFTHKGEKAYVCSCISLSLTFVLRSAQLNFRLVRKGTKPVDHLSDIAILGREIINIHIQLH